MNKRTLWILGAIVLVAIPSSYFAYAATLGVKSSKVTVHRQGATIAVPSPSPSAPPPSTPTPVASVSPSSATSKTCTVTSVADATINEGARTAAAATGNLAVRSERNKNKHALVRFDLSSCSIPSSATVTSATMRFTTVSAPASSRTYSVQPVTSSWAESVTWATKPSFGAATASASSGAAGSTLTWTVTNDVKGFVATPASNFGWQVVDSVPDASSFIEATFGSRDSAAAARPTLVVNYTS